MMRLIDNVTQERFSRQAAAFCTCWRLTRLDGFEIGLTDHDEDLAFGGTVFSAGGGEARALRQAADLSPDDSETIGILNDDRVSRRDLLAGRWDGARVEVWRVDWEEPAARLLLRTGTIGQVTVAEGRFTAEFRSLKHHLSSRLGRVYARTCDAELGDARCRADLGAPGFAADFLLDEEGERLLSLPGAESFNDGWFTGGVARAVSGPLSGVARGIKEHAGGQIALWQAFPEPLAPGTSLRLTAGCDKRLSTCREKFGNVLNFRGHPHMPGNDVLTATPSPGEAGE